MIPSLRAVALVAAAVAMTEGVALAQEKQACADAYVAGQVARKAGRLRDARARFDVCAAPACPASLRRDCEPWRTQLDGEIPTLAVTVTDDAGATIAGASITVDGAPIGPSSSFDPGDHTVHVEAPGMASSDQRVTLASGERGHPVRVRLARIGVETPPASSAAVPVAPIVVGAVGIAGLAVFAGLGAAGNSKKSALDALDCKPNCSSSAVSSARSLYIGADVAVGIGAAALVAAGVLLIVHFTGSHSSSTKPATGLLRGGHLAPSRGGFALSF